MFRKHIPCLLWNNPSYLRYSVASKERTGRQWFLGLPILPPSSRAWVSGWSDALAVGRMSYFPSVVSGQLLEVGEVREDV